MYRNYKNDNRTIIGSFITSCLKQSKNKRILEYTFSFDVLTANLWNNNTDLSFSYICPNPIADVLNILRQDITINIYSNKTSPLATEVFDEIIFFPPLGGLNISIGNEVSRIGSQLDDCGRIYWITSRSVIWSGRAKSLLDDLRSIGLWAHAVIDLPSGVFLNTNIEGIIIVFRKEKPSKKLAAVLRDDDTALQISSLLTNKTQNKKGANWDWLDADDTRTFSNIQNHYCPNVVSNPLCKYL